MDSWSGIYVNRFRRIATFPVAPEEQAFCSTILLFYICILPSIRPEPRRCRHLPTYYSPPQSQQSRLNYSPSSFQHLQRRTFLSSFIPSPPHAKNGNSNNGRVLTASRTLPYAPPPLFKVISSVDSYAEFLPFLNSSTVTARDKETGYPSQAYLTVGYGPLSETFTSKVDCDSEKWIVEARSGEKFGIFEYLSTKWELVPESGAAAGNPKTTVKLEIRFEFKNQWYATMMGAVEGQMAGVMIEAFEKRIREVNGG
ncbi:hypothetical protein ASPVEDRAFT_56020 [Aspergillus versicolor CBS 583.65]|uniref:Coenzyme Q-binding protein COQ10 START domain-containing protein n=1 Tax=Aspergillus versicolor CBS 583.65 TaxID=1036611 RepID=A0A1L9PXX5_ASPVE|nr:uncharacterized protein ASPVEDRAFT_56020 [Aspergillus versicolor CBS 583.65]OJJ06368.1 hypothetical protein ASPVEDRAFT_56020 [Aspergillus versicolor CBS 583.65]